MRAKLAFGQLSQPRLNNGVQIVEIKWFTQHDHAVRLDIAMRAHIDDGGSSCDASGPHDFDRLGTGKIRHHDIDQQKINA